MSFSPGHLAAVTSFQSGDYSRCAATVDRLPAAQRDTPAVAFLGMYASYLALEEREGRLQQPATLSLAKQPTGKRHEGQWASLERRAAAATDRHPQDGFLWYLSALVQLAIGTPGPAVERLCRAVSHEPCLWSAWSDLAELCAEEEPEGLPVPARWQRSLFFLAAHLRWGRGDRALPLASAFRARLPALPAAARALGDALYQLHRYEDARAALEQAKTADPSSLRGLETLSNVLFVLGDRAALCALAQEAAEIDRFSPETAYILGNLHGLRGDHAKAVASLRRSLALRPDHTAAWLLLGHEYTELAAERSAVAAYAHAARRAPGDYRCWYSLGQCYELLHLPHYALHYYRKATVLRPTDPRMWSALGHCAQKSGMLSEATRCFRRAVAHSAGDPAPATMLAGLYRDRRDMDRAAKYYRLALRAHDAQKASPDEADTREAVAAMGFLMQHAFDAGKLGAAEALALRLRDLEWGQSSRQAAAYLAKIRGRRAGDEAGAGAGAGVDGGDYFGGAQAATFA